MLRIILSTLLLIAPGLGTAQEQPFSYSIETVVACRTLPQVFAIIHTWEHYGFSEALIATNYFARNRKCFEYIVVNNQQGVAVSNKMILFDHHHQALPVFIREGHIGALTVFYIDQ
ncbi:MAG TPA: hypothetical protein VKP88_04610 [Candidatus Paceibacterota bacterium]|nr:hypothetical protein [Candidatus Paceibacterota bacterium]